MNVLAQIKTLIDHAKSEQKTSCPPAAAREFALAITHLEDASMRYWRGVGMKGVIQDPNEVLEVAAQLPGGTTHAEQEALAESA